MAKAKKARASKYDEKLAIDGTFEELIKVSANYSPPKKEKAKKPTREEYKEFERIYGGGSRYCQTDNLLQAARLIGSAQYFSGTQSSCLAIAEGLGRTYRYERSPHMDNVRMGVERETILNNRTRKIHFAYSSLQGIWRNLKSR